jgi:TonB-dependent siderophore receptor
LHTSSLRGLRAENGIDMRSTGAALVLAGLPLSAAAQQPAPSPTPTPDSPRYEERVDVEGSHPIPTIASTATKLPAPIETLPVTVSVVGSAVLEAQHARVLGDALENVPGVYAATGFGVFDYFTIRGFDSLSSSLVLVDGGAEPESSFYHLYNVGRVEVVKGPGAYLYGGSPQSGTVNLVRKQPASGRFGEAEVSGGSFRTFGGRLDANYTPARSPASLRLNAFYDGSGNYRDFKTSRAFAVNPSATWRFDERTPLTVSLEYVNNSFEPDVGLPIIGGVVPEVPRTRSYQSPFDFSSQELLRLRADFQTRLGARGTLRDKLYYTDLTWDSDGTLFTGAFPGFAGDFVLMRALSTLADRQKLLGNQLEASWILETGRLRHTLLTGFEASQLADDFTIDVSSLPPIGVFDPYETAEEPLVPLPGLAQAGDTRAVVVAPYVSDQIAWGDKLQALAALRYDNLDFRDDVSGTQRRDDQWSPRLGLLVSPWPKLSLYANFGKAFGPPSSTVVGEREPERSTQYEAGARTRLLRGKLALSAAAFQIDKHNIAIPDEIGLTREQGSARSRGLEIEAHGEIRPGWFAFANYALTDAKLTEFRELVTFSLVPPIFSVVDRSGNRMPFAPRNVFNLWTQREWNNGFGAAAGARYVCTQFIAEDNDFKAPEHWLFDAALSYKRKSLGLRLNVKNGANRESYSRGFSNTAVIPANPFAVYASLRWSLGSRP